MQRISTSPQNLAKSEIETLHHPEETTKRSSDNFLDMKTAFKSMEPQLLGLPGTDNALYVKVNTGKSIYRALFDCGANCLTGLPFTEVSKIDSIFFSHLHFDHIAGFDHFLRMNFDRDGKPIQIFGPPRTAEILHHRLQGVLWDRIDGSQGKFLVTEISAENTTTFQMKSSDGFQSRELVDSKPFTGRVVDNSEIEVRAVTLDHGTPSIGYLLGTKASSVIDTEKLQAMNLKPGPWLQAVKNMEISPETEVNAGGKNWSVGDLRSQLLTIKTGESIGYLTDFRLDGKTFDTIVGTFKGCDVLVCENNYRDEEAHLAKKNYHITSSEVGVIASATQAANLLLFHLSDRYTGNEWFAQLSDVRQAFPNTYLPSEWSRILNYTD